MQQLFPRTNKWQPSGCAGVKLVMSCVAGQAQHGEPAVAERAELDERQMNTYWRCSKWNDFASTELKFVLGRQGKLNTANLLQQKGLRRAPNEHILMLQQLERFCLS